MEDDKLKIVDDGFDLNKSYNLSSEISKSISRVNSIRKKFEMYEPLTELELNNLNNMFEEEEIFTSNHIEGNSYNLNDTHFILETGIPVQGKKLKDANEIVNLKKAINYSKEYNGDLTEEFIKNLHKLITSNTLSSINNEGNYKTVRNWVGNLNTNSPQSTPKHVEELLEWFYSSENINILSLASEFKFRFIKIHPFIDGNGRTSRLIFNYMLTKNGYVPLSILPEDKEDYYKALIKCTENNTESLGEFMCGCLVKTYERRIEKLED